MRGATEKGFQPDGAAGLALAGISTAIALCISGYCIYKHLTNYSLPRIQRYIVRILFVSPVYVLGSVFSLRFPKAGVGLETIRDIMEAFVIYSFLALVLEYAGGDSSCVNRIKNEPPLHHPPPLCCLKPINRDGRFLRLCKQGTLQFAFIKPFMAALSLIMMSKGQYHSKAYQAIQLVVYNISYSIALYCLALFYLGTRIILSHYSPISKFLAVKSVVFATYWQSLVIRLWAGPEEASGWNNFILCLEMIPFSMFLGLAFSHKEYRRGIPDSSVLRNIKEVLSVRDVVQDAYHNFMPTYQDYVLQRGAAGGGSVETSSPTKYRTRTFLAGNIDRWKLTDHDHLGEEDDEEEGGEEGKRGGGRGGGGIGGSGSTSRLRGLSRGGDSLIEMGIMDEDDQSLVSARGTSFASNSTLAEEMVVDDRVSRPGEAEGGEPRRQSKGRGRGREADRNSGSHTNGNGNKSRGGMSGLMGGPVGAEGAGGGDKEEEDDGMTTIQLHTPNGSSASMR